MLSGDLESKLHDAMCLSAAECIQGQCGAEYAFPGEKHQERGHRATDLTTVPEHILAQAPTNNLIAERQLSRFSRLSEHAKCQNRKHNLNTLRDNMVLAAAEKQKLSDCSKTVKEVLKTMNIDWNATQRRLKLKRFKKKNEVKRKKVLKI